MERGGEERSGGEGEERGERREERGMERGGEERRGVGVRGRREGERVNFS